MAIKTRVYTNQELIRMPKGEFKLISEFIRWRCWNLLGMKYKTYIKFWTDPITNNYHFEWDE